MTKKTLVVIATLCIVVGLTPAHAATAELQPSHRAATLPLAAFYGYATPTITISKGDQLIYTNLDLDRHNIVQDVAEDGRAGKPNVHWCKGGDDHDHDHGHGCPVFWSPLIGFQASTQVEGLDRVEPGETYTFLCTLHHSMKGQLIVRP